MTYDLIIKIWETYQNLVDRGLSFTDCSLLAVAEYLERSDILSVAKEFDELNTSQFLGEVRKKFDQFFKGIRQF